MRVAIIGAGVAGSSCAWRLLAGKTNSSKVIAVSIFEMGRGAGGRSGTRHVKEFPGLHINHGAPLFHVPTSDLDTAPLISALISSRYLLEWHGTYGRIDFKTGAISSGGASRGELEIGTRDFKRYTGAPYMSSVARGCIQLAKDADGENLQTHFAVRVKDIIPQRNEDGVLEGWEIRGQDGKSFGVFDYIVASGATPALDRWRAGFKEEPPVYVAAQSSGTQLFPTLLTRLDRPLDYEQTHIVSLAWDVTRDENSIKQNLAKLGFDITEVEGDESLAKVILQSVGPTYAVIVLHSTAAFARKHKKVKGAGSFVSVANNVEGSIDEEAQVANELFKALQDLLARSGAAQLPKPTWGPALHRWGAAFPKPQLGDLSQDRTWVLSNDRFLFAGDYLAAPNASVATALRSGIAAGSALLQLSRGLPVDAPKIDIQSAL